VPSVSAQDMLVRAVNAKDGNVVFRYQAYGTVSLALRDRRQWLPAAAAVIAERIGWGRFPAASKAWLGTLGTAGRAAAPVLQEACWAAIERLPVIEALDPTAPAWTCPILAMPWE
jgi:hypothetical protein